MLGLSEKVPRVRKAMHHRSHLGLDQCSARRSRLDLGELLHQDLKSIQRLHVANKLRRQLLVFDDGLGDPFPQRICKKAIPRSPRALSKLMTAISPSVV